MNNLIKIILIILVLNFLFKNNKVEKFTDVCTSLDEEYEDWECNKYDDKNKGYDSLKECLDNVDNDQDRKWCNNCNRISNKLEENNCVVKMSIATAEVLK